MEKLHKTLLSEHLKKENITPKYTIYCDMDGVLCDFDKRFIHFTSQDPNEYKDRYGEKRFWHLINNQIGEKFWSNMDWMEGGKKLWEFLSTYNPVILTSPSRHGSSKTGKNKWVNKHIGATTKVIFSNSKQEYASPECILIDDRKSNIQKFKNSGGITIRCAYGRVEDVIKELKELGYE